MREIACSYRNFLYRFRSSITFAPPASSLLFSMQQHSKDESGSIQSLWGRCSMWIFDSYFKGCVELWGRERGLTRIVQRFHLHSICTSKTRPPIGR